MKLITRDTDYALRALVYLMARPRECVSSAEVEKETGIPRPFLRKILQKLCQAEVLASLKGREGGFRLKEGAEKMSLLSLSEIFQGKLQLAQCFFQRKICPRQPHCFLRKELKALERLLQIKFQRLTLAKLAKEMGQIQKGVKP